jgi:hypothetical protein
MNDKYPVKLVRKSNGSVYISIDSLASFLVSESIAASKAAYAANDPETAKEFRAKSEMLLEYAEDFKNLA